MEGGYLAVARLRKPHGLKGEVYVWSLTDEPEAVFTVGRELMPIDETGQPAGAAVVIERSRAYHRHWLLKFSGIDDRAGLEGWEQRLFGVPQRDLRPPAADELYLHEIPGTAVLVAGQVIGVASGLIGLPGGGGHLLAVEVKGREVLVPFRRPIVTRIDREARLIEIDPPAGLLEL